MFNFKNKLSTFFFFNIFLLVLWSNKFFVITNGDVIPNVIVAADKSGNYTKVGEAVFAAPNHSMQRYVILVKRGVYMERVEILREKWNISIIGEGMGNTIITGKLSRGQHKLENYNTSTIVVIGAGFMAQDISFKNTAGPENGQALAFYSDSDFSVLYRVEIFGYQDSLCANTNRQFYKECKISGTVDFIFGYANAVFQNCQILAKKGTTNTNTITAQGSFNDIQTGFVFQFCNISADQGLLPWISSISTFLGRPWKTYSRTVFMESTISGVLNPKGWLEWEGHPEFLNTLYYAEFQNDGLGAKTENRVKWSGYHLLNHNQAKMFTVSNFISGDQWIPLTGVPYIGGLGVKNTT